MHYEIMQFAIKLLISLLVISACAAIGKKAPSLAGLIATMPLTTLIVLFWFYSDNARDYARLAAFAKGVVWGIVPSMLFFITAYGCFRKEVPFGCTLAISFGVWLVGAVLHQLFLRWLP